MKRFLYSVPVMFLLVVWGLLSALVLVLGFADAPHLLFFLVPIDAVLAGAFYIHRRRSALGQHFFAAAAASAVLFVPLATAVIVLDERPAKYSYGPKCKCDFDSHPEPLENVVF